MGIIEKLLNTLGMKGPAKKPTRILVTGNPKTGTTALYHSIRYALPENKLCYFEPENRNIELVDAPDKYLLVKSFVPVSSRYDDFDKKILIVRDPRDHLISSMLYSPYNIALTGLREKPDETEALLGEILRLLRKKEADPGSVAVTEIMALMGMGRNGRQFDQIIHYYLERPDLFVFRYEDYVDGHFDPINEYLGLKLDVAEKVPETRVVRSKSYGNWKDWMLPGDIEKYRENFKEYMVLFGYADDWQLSGSPVIDPALSSGYVEKLISDAKTTILKMNSREK